MNIRYAMMLMIAALACIATAAAQESSALLDSYVRNFDKSDVNAKLRLIEDAATLNNPQLAPLFLRAIDFSTRSTERGKNESIIRQFSVIAVEQCEKYKFIDARASIWKLFQMDLDSNARIKSLKALGVLAQKDKTLIGYINEWLAGQLSAFKAGKKPPLNIIVRCVQTLGVLNDESSFTVIFNTINAGFSQEISALCRQVLVNLKGDFKTLLIQLIKNGTIREKKEALIIAIDSTQMSDNDKGDIAEGALDTGLRTGSVVAEEVRDLREIRSLANRALSVRRWGKATVLILQYFEQTLAEFDRGVANKQEVIEIIRALGNMGTHGAAERLSLYLDLLNAYTEKRKVYDEQIVSEVIESLGRLGDKIAFDYLMRVKFLNYSAPIKTRADEAIKNLK